MPALKQILTKAKQTNHASHLPIHTNRQAVKQTTTGVRYHPTIKA